MPGSGRGPGLSGLGVRAGTTQRESRHSLPDTATGNQLADEWGVPVPVLPEALHSPAMDKAMNKITIHFGSLFGSPTSTAASRWPANTVGAGGLEPPAPRL